MKEVFFNTHHSPFGAYFSFIMGKEGAKGGYVLNDVKSPNANIYIGYKKGKDDLFLLPFFQTRESMEQLYVTADEDKASKNVGIVREIPKDKVTRELCWATDNWKAGDLAFSLYTPFKPTEDIAAMSDEEIRKVVLPAIFAKVSFDNSKGDEDVIMVFGMEGMGRLLSETTHGKIYGGAKDRRIAFGCISSDDVEEKIGWTVPYFIARNEYETNKLGNEVLLSLKVKAGCKSDFIIAIGAFRDGNITSGLDTSFAYTNYFKDIEDVIQYALKNSSYYIEEAEKRDKELKVSGLNDDRQFLIAQAAHSYYSNTELLSDKNGKLLWVVNEGEYQMMNTFDLTVDQIFWEMKFHPWTVKNNLELYLNRYSYVDQIKDKEGNRYAGGISFTHDMGVADMFSPKGYSAYERENISGCFSYMTSEQLLNWILCGSVYGLSKDNEWLAYNNLVFMQCFDSLVARDLNEDGIIDSDSMRCKLGSEITTYDSLDISLGQARNNLYLAVKTWAAYVCLQNVFKKLGIEKYEKSSFEKSKLIAKAITKKYDGEKGYIPAVFENNNTSAIIPAVEGLIYPFVLKDLDAVSEKGRYAEFVTILKKHIKTVLQSGICIDEISGGWRLSSTSNNTWLSKIFLSQYIVQNILKVDFAGKWDNWDKIHAAWLSVSCSELCAVDQVYSENGKDRGSRLYPRLVTNILWMEN